MDLRTFLEVDRAVKNKTINTIHDVLFRNEYFHTVMLANPHFSTQINEAINRLYITVNGEKKWTVTPGGIHILQDYIGGDFTDDQIVSKYSNLITPIPIKIRTRLAETYYPVSTFLLQTHLIGTERESILEDQLVSLNVPMCLADLDRQQFNFLRHDLEAWQNSDEAFGKWKLNNPWPAYFTVPIAGSDYPFWAKYSEKLKA
jgi:hypothetical protein